MSQIKPSRTMVEFLVRKLIFNLLTKEIAVPDSIVPPATPAGISTNSGLSQKDRLALFNSKEAQEIKAQICDIGQRLWQREYVDANGGNISCRIGPDEFICTPTLVSKGFMKPEMMCMVDIEGNQIAGTWKQTSEITTHLAIYKATPEAKAVVHAHPVHATAFAMAGFELPQNLIPELEIFVGKVPLAPYRTPGSREMADVIQPLAAKHQSIMMGNHGLICWGTGVEDAYFKVEITDAYCRTIVVASHVPSRGTSIPGNEVEKLLNLKKKLGLPDARHGLTPVQLGEEDPWEQLKPCVCMVRETTEKANLVAEKLSNAELEALVQQLTSQIMESLEKGRR